MALSTKIYGITAREILDSRNNPTIETTVILESGYRGTVSIPSGASVGKYEAVELRDKDPKRYGGMGVLKAVAIVNTLIGPKLRGQDVMRQRDIDAFLIQLDGTPNKSKLGSNSVLSVSLACAVAAAAGQNMPLFRYLNTLFQSYLPTTITRMPTPTFNIINGGKHGAGNLNFQEFHVIPATSKPYHVALQMGVEIYDEIKRVLLYRNAVHSVGDEGGFAPNLFTNLEALEVLMEGIHSTSYHFGVDVFLGLDVAANSFKVSQGYQIKDRPNAITPKDFIAYLKSLHEKYRLLVLEDPLEEDDWGGWKELTQTMGKEIMIVGDDLLVTNLTKLERAIKEKSCSGILLKPNQVGTLTEFFVVAAKAKTSGIGTIVSHRSGETNDTFIADLGVAIQSDYVKFGAPVRGERVAKYNRLLAIESELQQSL